MALPKCAPASPETISEEGFSVDFAWQDYRKNPPTTPEHRCCARVCEPIIRYAASIENNAMALNAVARNPKVPKAERDRALANANTLFERRRKLVFDFRICLAETRPKGTGAAARCGMTSFDQIVLDSYAWCDEFAKRQQRFRDLLVSTVGNNVGSWRAQSNWFRIRQVGTVDEDSVSMRGEPSTHLPAGKGSAPFKAIITNGTSFLPFPDLMSRMYMRFTASAVRLAGPAGTKALDTSVLIDGVCPGPRDRPAG
ncbi:MAG: hypothetical protein U1E14_08455 [Geminicoccaceae bacterium]